MAFKIQKTKNFEEQIKINFLVDSIGQLRGVVLVKQIKPVIEEISNEMQDQVLLLDHIILKVNQTTHKIQ